MRKENKIKLLEKKQEYLIGAIKELIRFKGDLEEAIEYILEQVKKIKLKDL